MSVLAWLFGLGALTVAFPIVFHLIRKTPKGRQPFSSLMFLDPSPPRLTRRSTLDQWLLLLLRATALIMLSLAFMRPFWRNQSLAPLLGAPGRRIAVVLDNSASMRRGDLWSQAQAEVDKVLDDLEATDEIALFTFGNQLDRQLDFLRPAVDGTDDRRAANRIGADVLLLNTSFAGPPELKDKPISAYMQFAWLLSKLPSSPKIFASSSFRSSSMTCVWLRMRKLWNRGTWSVGVVGVAPGVA